MGIRVLGVCLFSLALYLAGRFVWKKRIPLPPGPSGWPLIGNLLDVPMHAPYKMFGAMSRKYGPIISFNLMGMRYVVLNSPKVAIDLLKERSAVTSNRPHFTMGCDLVSSSDVMVLLQYGDTHRKHRKFVHQQIGSKSSLKAFYPAEEAEAKRFLRNILKNPDDLITHCSRAAGAVILKILHGYAVRENGDPLVEMANKVMDNLTTVTTPGRFLVDMRPILRYLPEWFPGGGFHEGARRWRRMLSEAVHVSYEFVLEHLAKGDATPSFISRVLQEGVTPEEEEILKWTSFTMYLGGSDTTPSTLSAFFLAMIMYPEIMKKAQAEVDAVVGHDRLPTFEDRDALPYVNAICMELFRWHVVASVTLHVATQDISYEGYLIPKGTFLLANIWFILSDPETYPNPDVFNPERFLGEHQQLDPHEACFGWGRRSCPGSHLAELTVFMFVAMALSTLNVSRCVENGVKCVPGYEAEEGVVRRIKPFKCRIVRRSKKAEDLLQA